MRSWLMLQGKAATEALTTANHHQKILIQLILIILEPFMPSPSSSSSEYGDKVDT
jgi:hypothetical protein